MTENSKKKTGLGILASILAFIIRTVLMALKEDARFQILRELKKYEKRQKELRRKREKKIRKKYSDRRRDLNQ